MEEISSIVDGKSAMVEEPEESNASRNTRTLKRAMGGFAEPFGRDPRSFSPRRR